MDMEVPGLIIREILDFMHLSKFLYHGTLQSFKILLWTWNPWDGDAFHLISQTYATTEPVSTLGNFGQDDLFSLS
jgi:hypothetical protein